MEDLGQCTNSDIIVVWIFTCDNCGVKASHTFTTDIWSDPVVGPPKGSGWGTGKEEEILCPICLLKTKGNDNG